MKLTRKTEFGKAVSPFYQLGMVTYRIIYNSSLFDNYFKRITGRLKIIYPKYKESEIIESYISYKLMCIYIFFILCLIFSFIYNNSFNTEEIREFKRPDCWGEDEQQQIVAKIKDTENKVDLTVSHREVPEETLRLIMEEKAKELPNYILENNKSIDMINSNIRLISQIPDTQINVYWEIEENDVLLSDGSIVTEMLRDKGTLVKLSAVLNYKNIDVNTEFFVNVVKPELTKKQQTEYNLNQLIKDVDYATVTNDSLILPDEIDGEAVTYARKEDENNKIVFIAMFSICIPLLFFSQDEKLEKRKVKRERQMMMDYPEIINKMILYLGAGLTIQGAFEMIAESYLKEKKSENLSERYAYEEVVFFIREVHGGISFRNGLERFSVRCGVQSFRKLSVLLLQNLKKGSGELIGLLHSESVIAFDKRKISARKLGEEAGTKLLFPMILSLGVVLVILVVPACMLYNI